VIGVKDDRLGEDLCAVLRIKPGSKVTPKDVAEHLSGKLARFKIPKIVKYVDEYPKTASEKVQKYKIKDMIATGKL
jgi:acyl-CoA synthetase (AMP-forming)/AMP-acid ligase II